MRGIAALVLMGWMVSAGAMDVYVEDSPAAVELANRAALLAEQGRLSEAVATYQQVVAEFPGKLMPLGAGAWQDTLWWVRGKVGGDAALRKVFIEDHEPAAAGTLEQARRGRDYRDWDRDALRNVMQRYWLTPSGLSAGLDLSAMALLEGDLSSAGALLDELRGHPSLQPDGEAVLRTRYDTLRDGWEQAQGLANAGDETTPTEVKPGDSGGPGALEAPGLEQAMWTRPLSARSEEVQDGLALMQQARAGGSPGISVVPVLAGDRLLLNEGDTVRSLDRVSGRPVWEHGLTEQADGLDPRQARALMRMTRWLPDRRGVLVEGDRVYAVLGRGSQPLGRFGAEAVVVTRLVCLSLETGSLLWSMRLEEPAGGLERTHLSGTPVWASSGALAGEGLVLVAARRVEMTGFVTSMVVAVEAGTGRVRWKRHLASTSVGMGGGLIGPGGPGGVTGIAVDGRWAYLGDGLATAACVEVSGGGVRWLRRLIGAAHAGDPEAIPGAGAIPGGAIPGGRGVVRDVWGDAVVPVRVRGGWVVGINGFDGPGVVLLSEQDGSEVKRLMGDRLGEVNGLRGVGGDLLTLGRRVSRWSGEALDLRWSVRADRLAEEAAGPTATNRPGQLPDVAGMGRAALDGRRVVLPMHGAWVTLSLKDGSLLGAAGGPSGANLVMDGPEVFAATDWAVSFFADWDHAYALLKRRIANEPGSADAALGLSYLAARTDRPQAVLEGIDAAVAVRRQAGAPDEAENAPNPGEKAQGSPVMQLIDLLLETPALSPAVASAGLDRLATALRGPAEVSAYHLARGRVEESLGHPAEAVGHYQAVLADPQLARQAGSPGSPRAPDAAAPSHGAGLTARQRLLALIAQHGPSLYAPFEQQAQRELQALVNQPDTTPEQLLALAERFPPAPAAAQAQLHAGRLLAQGARPQLAVGPLRRVYQLSADEPLKAQAGSELASLYLRLNQPARAARWLRLVAREHPQLLLDREGQPVTASAWLALIDADDAEPTRLPTLQPPLAAGVPIPGTLLPPADPLREPTRRDRFVVRHRQQLHLLQADSLREVASMPDPGDDVQQLCLDDQQLLVWSPSSAAVWAYDSDTGRASWPTLSLREELEAVASLEAIEERRGTREARTLVRMFDPGAEVRDGQVVATAVARPEPLFVLANDDVIVAVDGVGRVVAFDRFTGRPMWQTLCPVESVSGLWLGGDTAVVRGLVAVGSDAQAAAVVALDLITGQPRSNPVEEREEALHAQILDAGLLAVVYPRSVACFDPDTGQLAWRMELPQAAANAPVTLAGTLAEDDRVLIASTLETPAQVFLLDPHTGQRLAQRFDPVALSGTLPPTRRILLAEEHAYTGSPTPLCFDPAGQTLWRAAVRDPRMTVQHQHLTADHLAVLMLDARQPQGNTLARRLMLFRRDTGKLESDTPLPLGNPGSLDRVLPLDNAVAVTLQQHTYVLRGR